MIKITYSFSIEDDRFREMYDEEEERGLFADYVYEMADDMSVNDIMEMSSDYDKSVDIS